MSENLDPLESLEEIKSYMQKSTRFLTLNGWSGVWVGVWGVIAGSFFIYFLGKEFSSISSIDDVNLFYIINDTLRIEQSLLHTIIFIAFWALLLSLAGGVLFTIHKTRKEGVNFINHVSKRIFINCSIPLIAGGLVCLAFYKYNLFGLLPSTTIIFYGLALLIGARDTLKEVRSLAIINISLGIISLFFFKYVLVFWIIVFGFLHIFYGILVNNKYQKR